MANVKMTKRDYFNALLALNAVAENAELVEFINHEIELLDKKSSTPKKPTQAQVENEGFKTEIIQYLTEVDMPKTIKELQANIPSISDLTNQRITHILTTLVNSGTLVKEYVKKVPYYSVA